jgi:phosphoglycolate phosphatase
MNNRYNLFIFDLDGTLVDSAQQITAAINNARVEFGHPEIELEHASTLIGLPATDLVVDLEVSVEETDAIINRFRNILLESVEIENPVFPGVIEFLEECKKFGIILGVATSKPHYIAQKVILNSELNGYFSHVQGVDGFPGKPNPEVINRVINVCKSQSSLMFGDRIEDILAASTAGIDSIGIAQGTHSQEQLAAVGASRTFNNFSDAITLFNSFLFN